jgi:hypothetical protein
MEPRHRVLYIRSHISDIVAEIRAHLFHPLTLSPAHSVIRRPTQSPELPAAPAVIFMGIFAAFVVPLRQPKTHEHLTSKTPDHEEERLRGPSASHPFCIRRFKPTRSAPCTPNSELRIPNSVLTPFTPHSPFPIPHSAFPTPHSPPHSSLHRLPERAKVALLSRALLSHRCDNQVAIPTAKHCLLRCFHTRAVASASAAPPPRARKIHCNSIIARKKSQPRRLFIRILKLPAPAYSSFPIPNSALLLPNPQLPTAHKMR